MKRLSADARTAEGDSHAGPVGAHLGGAAAAASAKRSAASADDRQALRPLSHEEAAVVRPAAKAARRQAAPVAAVSPAAPKGLDCASSPIDSQDSTIEVDAATASADPALASARVAGHARRSGSTGSSRSPLSPPPEPRAPIAVAATAANAASTAQPSAPAVYAHHSPTTDGNGDAMPAQAAELAPHYRPRPARRPLAARHSVNICEIWKDMTMRERRHSARYFRSPGHQPSVTAWNRAVLLDWLVDVCEHFGFVRETYYLAVSFFDAYVAVEQQPIHRSKIQLVGTVCMLIAAKMEEFTPIPLLTTLAELTAGACTVDEIVELEPVILKALEWELLPVTATAWLDFYMQSWGTRHALATAGAAGASQAGPDLHHRDASALFTFITFNVPERRCYYRAAQVLDLATLHAESAKYIPSALAASAICLTANDSSVNATSLSGYTIEQLAPCLRLLERFTRFVKDLPLDHTLAYLSTYQPDPHPYGVRSIRTVPFEGLRALLTEPAPQVPSSALQAAAARHRTPSASESAASYEEERDGSFSQP